MIDKSPCGQMWGRASTLPHGFRQVRRFAPFAGLALLFTLASVLSAQTGAAKTFDIYFLDMEGGHSTLYVSPSGQSLLEDTGSPGDRDVNRIMAVIKAAGVTKLDYLVITHYHVDHVGGLEELAKRIPIAHFIDHGATVEPKEQVPGFQHLYATLYEKAEHTVVKPGDKIPFAGVDTVVVTAAGKTIKTPLPGGGKPDSACAEFKERDESHVDPENPQSVGLVFTYGRFRTVNLGDFTWNAERDLMCPNNPIGHVDLYLTSHHGIDQSGSPALVHGLSPRVAVMHNGTRKGGTPQTFTILRSSPGLEDIWQLHWSWSGGIEYNQPGLFIANLDAPETLASVIANAPPFGGFGPNGRGNIGPGGPPQGAAPAGSPGMPPTQMSGRGPGGGRGGHTGEAFWIKASANTDGSFTVTNTRNGFSKFYPRENR